MSELTTPQEYANQLITVIRDAEDPESVTNEMVAFILDFLKQSIEGEKTNRSTADNQIHQKIDRLIGGNTSQAIDNFNEVIAFLSGIKDNESLAELLDALPGKCKSVALFGGTRYALPTLSNSRTTLNGRVIYCEESGTFLWEISPQYSTATNPVRFFTDWAGGDFFGESSATGHVAETGRLYINTTTNIQYRWTTSGLVPVGSHLVLGETEDEAFPGDRGMTLENQLTEISETLMTPEDVTAAYDSIVEELREVYPGAGLEASPLPNNNQEE